MYIQIGFKQIGLGKHLQLTDVDGKHEYYSSKKNFIVKFIWVYFYNLVKHILNPLGLAKYEIRKDNKVIADVK